MSGIDRVCQGLTDYDPLKYHRIELEEGAVPTIHLSQKANWLNRVIKYIVRFFCREDHPAEKVAIRLTNYFETYKDQIRTNHVPALLKLQQIKCLSHSTVLSINGLLSFIFAKIPALEQQAKDALNQAQDRSQKIVDAADDKAKDALKQAQEQSKKVVEAAEKTARDIETSALEERAVLGYKANDALNRSREVLQKIEEQHKQAQIRSQTIIATAQQTANDLEKLTRQQRAELLAKMVYVAKPIAPLFDDDKILANRRLVCADGELPYIWPLLLASPLLRKLETYDDANYQAKIDAEKDQKAKDTLIRERDFHGHIINFPDYTIEIVKLFMNLSKGMNCSEFGIDNLLKLHNFLLYVGETVHLDKVCIAIRSRFIEAPEAFFEIMPNLSKTDPVLEVLIPLLTLQTTYRRWSDLFTNTQIKKLADWIKEYEEPAYSRYLKSDPSIIPLLAQLYSGCFGSSQDQQDHKRSFAFLRECVEEPQQVMNQLDLKHSHAQAVNPIPRITQNVNPTAIALLALHYLKGEGTPVDLTKGRILAKEASNQGDPFGRHLCISMLMSGAYETAKDEEAAYKLWKQSLVNNDYEPIFVQFDVNHYAPTLIKIGDYYQKKRETSLTVLNCYDVAARLGYLNGLTQGGILRLKPVLFSDREKGLADIRKAAILGDSSGQTCLGEFHESGMHGVEKNREKAVIWYEKAARQGDPRAIEALKRLHEG